MTCAAARRARDGRGLHLQHLPRRARRRARRRQRRSSEILRTSDDSEPAPARVGGVEADRRRGRRPRARAARACATRRRSTSGTATTSRSRSPRASSTRSGCSRRWTRSTTRRRHRSPRGRAALDEALATRFGCGIDELRPWHLDDPFFQDPPTRGAVDLDALFAGRDLEALTLRTYDGIGLDVRHVLDNSDLYARDGKSQHAFCIDIDRDGDVRVLCNVEPNERWMDTMLHEFGHGIYDREVRRDVPWLLREASHPLTTEGVAMLFGRLARDPEWLDQGRRCADERASSACALASTTRGRAALLTFARWVLVVTHFEQRFYADPEADLDSLWWELVERYQQMRTPRRPPRPRLGGEDPPRGRARLLPELPLRRARRVAARCNARRAHRRVRRTRRRRPAARRATSSGPARRCAGITSSSRRPATP